MKMVRRLITALSRNKRRSAQLIHTLDRISLVPRLHRAVATLKLQAPDTDPKAAFWEAYMKMADEHDKEFQLRYGTDLNTGPVFVRDPSFHAVSLELTLWCL